MDDKGQILEANLRQLERVEPELAERLHVTEPAALCFSPSKAGPLTATLTINNQSRALASQYDPLAEADRLIEKIDLRKHAGIVALGLGLGYHVARLAERVRDDGLIIVFEPDAGVLRAVLERVDHTAWIGRHNVLLCDALMDRGGLVGRIDRFAGSLTQGTTMITHPPTRQLHAEALNAFGRLVGEVMSYCRTNVATMLVNASRTIHNSSMNLGHYAAGATTDELLNAAKGYPAVCVGAGPSLAKNVDLLGDPNVRANVVVVGAQTVLKPLLDRRIQPDFVTALDYSSISRRFYEGLTDDLARVTLVAEPLAHPAILDGFPGPVRLTQSAFLDRLLGELARPIVPVPAGATVAHLSFYLAQHLGFSDGLYYCPGTAIDEVWAPELGPFNTLEMMEWQRIVRHRHHLQKRQDIHGRPIYTDEQMLTYLQQFERDFSRATQTVIDATEGGMPKLHTVCMPLREAAARYATAPVPALPIPPRTLDRRRLDAATARLDQRIASVGELHRLSQRTVPLLKDMLRAQRDRRRMEKLFNRLSPIRDRVAELKDTFAIVNDLNTIGAFKRARADRAIDHATMDEFEEQKQRLQRDVENVQWLIQACEEAMTIFGKALHRLRTFETPAPQATLAGAA